MTKVVQVAPSRNNRGGITTMLNRWKTSAIWEKYDCEWVETQDNRGVFIKFYYLIRSFFLAIILIPRCEIVHFHTTPGRSILVQMPVFLLGLLFRKRIIVQLHVGNQLFDFINDKTFRWVMDKADKIVVLAYVWKDLMVEKYGFPSEKIDVIYNPAPDVQSLSAKENYVLFMAYIVPNKGYDVMIKAFARVVKDFPEWRIVIAGMGELDKVRDLAIEYEIVDNIEIRNWVIGKEREELWRRAGAYCMASYQEGFPMAVLEAWSHGVPVITTPVGGLPDVIRDRENALVFGFGDVEGLESCFRQLFSSVELQRELSKKSIELVEKFFSLDIIAERVDTLYNQVAGIEK